MSRQTKLLHWRGDAQAAATVPELVFGPLYNCTDWFKTHPGIPWTVDSDHDWVWRPPDTHQTDPVCRAIAWRLAMMWNMVNKHGVLVHCFPHIQRRTFLAELLANIDSTIPLVDFIERAIIDNPESAIDTRYIYKNHKAPEQCRAAVIDETCVTDVLRAFIPLVFIHLHEPAFKVPSYIFRQLHLNDASDADERAVRMLYTLLRLVILRDHNGREILKLLYDALYMINTPPWLSQCVLLMLQMVLLGNFPGSSYCVAWKKRRLIYRWTWHSAVNYLLSCNNGVRLTDKDADIGVSMALLSQSLAVFLDPDSPQYIDQFFIVGWPEFNRSNKRVLDQIYAYFPAAPPQMLINDIGRFIRPLMTLFVDIYAALASLQRGPDHHTELWRHLYTTAIDWDTFTTLNDITAVLCRWEPETRQAARALQAAFDATHTAACIDSFTDPSLSVLISLAVWIMRRRIMKIIPASHALTLLQYTRMMEISYSTEIDALCTVLVCRQCNTARVRPVGIHLPRTHTTIHVNLYTLELQCPDCRSDHLEPVSLLGNFLRCILTNNHASDVVTIACCGACGHICVVEPDHFVRSMPVCSECYTQAPAVDAKHARRCLNSCPIAQKASSRSIYCLVRRGDDMAYEPWCAACIPREFNALFHATEASSRSKWLFDASELQEQSRLKRLGGSHGLRRPVMRRTR